MPLPAALERQLLESHGVTNLGPIVSFVDWAIKDEAESARLGRVKFKDVIFIEKRPRDGIGRDVFRRTMEAADKDDFPREWKVYQDRKQALNVNVPKIGLIPGITRARFEELTALGITDCHELANYPGDLHENEPIRQLAKRILEICNAQNREIPEVRQDLGASILRPVHSPDSGLWADPRSGTPDYAGSFAAAFARTAPESRQEKAPVKEETFRYNFG